MRPGSKTRYLFPGLRPDIRRGLGALAGALLLSGCALNGDFGRLRPELVTDDTHDWIGQDAVASIGAPASQYPLTDDERRLRDLAYPLIAPPYGRQNLDNAFREYGLPGWWTRKPKPFDLTAYWRRLAGFPRRSQASAYAQITTDAHNDADMIETFFDTARRVLDMDQRRAASLSQVTYLNQIEYANAINRNNENAAVIGWVCSTLGERAAAYHYALERLVIAVPALSAAEADRALSLLGMRIGAHCKPIVAARVARE
jgi:hypothetical protein